MRRFLNGQVGYGRLFWFGVVGPVLLARLAGQAIFLSQLGADNAALARLELAEKALLILLALWLLAMVRALMLAGGLGAPLRAAGLALTGMAALFALVQAVSLSFPRLPMPVLLMTPDLWQANLSLPRDLGNEVELERVSLESGALTYRLRLDRAPDPAARTALAAPLIDSIDGQRLCRRFAGYFRGGLGAVVYVYAFEGGAAEARLNAGDCLSRIAEDH